MITFFVSCTKKEEVKYIAKVGDTYLTEEEISEFNHDGADSTNFRKAFIRQWIEKELLYLAAKEQGIVQSKDFKLLLENLDKKTANSLLIKQIINNADINKDSLSVMDYYHKNRSEFVITQPMIVYNYASFKDYEGAEKFRISLYQNNWDDAINNAFLTNKIIFSGKEISSYIVKETHDNYKEVFNTLILNQVSRVMYTDDNQYRVFQLLEKYESNEIPNIKIIYQTVKDRYVAKQRELAYKNYIKQLYSEYSSRIER